MSVMGGPGCSRVHNKRGVGTVLVAGICLGLVLVAATATSATGQPARVEKAQDAADLTALAAAAAEADDGDACVEASKVTPEDSGRLTGCEVRGQYPRFVVEVTVTLPLLEGRGFDSADVEHSATVGMVWKETV